MNQPLIDADKTKYPINIHCMVVNTRDIFSFILPLSNIYFDKVRKLMHTMLWFYVLNMVLSDIEIGEGLYWYDSQVDAHVSHWYWKDYLKFQLLILRCNVWNPYGHPIYMTISLSQPLWMKSLY